MDNQDNMESIKDLNLDHCLRPEFTRTIINQLVSQRTPVNLIGDTGTGKARLIEDICKSHFPDVGMVCIDLKAHVNSYAGLLREIHDQLGLDVVMPEQLTRLFAVQNERVGQRILFCLDNYDALLGNVNKDDKYNVDFFNDLNYLKNRDNVVLLCTTSHPHSTLPVYIKGESYSNSWLILELVSLPPLTRKQVSVELQRRIHPEQAKELTATPADRERLEKSIYDHPMPYARLCFLVGKLNTQTEEEIKKSFKKRLKRWQKEFKRLHKNHWKKSLHNAKNTAKAAIIASGLNVLKLPFLSLGNFLRSLIGKKDESTK